MPAQQNFPRLRPSSRSYTPGIPATKEFVSMNGTVKLVNYGRQLSGDLLELGFTARTYAEAEEIYDNYREVMRDGDWVGFGNNHPCFQDSDGRQDMLTGAADGGRWRYAGPPKIDALTNGRCNIKVSLTKVLLTY